MLQTTGRGRAGGHLHASLGGPGSPRRSGVLSDSPHDDFTPCQSSPTSGPSPSSCILPHSCLQSPPGAQKLVTGTFPHDKAIGTTTQSQLCFKKVTSHTSSNLRWSCEQPLSECPATSPGAAQPPHDGEKSQWEKGFDTFRAIQGLKTICLVLLRCSQAAAVHRFCGFTLRPSGMVCKGKTEAQRGPHLPGTHRSGARAGEVSRVCLHPTPRMHLRGPPSS